jgi:hypothetical protein
MRDNGNLEMTVLVLVLAVATLFAAGRLHLCAHRDMAKRLASLEARPAQVVMVRDWGGETTEGGER